jgi:NAD(P)H-dependent flavin oxidoreductase YrpB (nitropropane dioxygenase family)
VNGNSISELKNARSPIVKAGMGGIATLFLLAGLAQWEGNSFPVYLDMVEFQLFALGLQMQLHLVG